MFNLIWVFIKNYIIEIFIVLLMCYAEYWHYKALDYRATIQQIQENSKIIEASINQSIQEENRKKQQEIDAIKKIQNAKVSNNCQEALNWMKGQLVKN